MLFKIVYIGFIYLKIYMITMRILKNQLIHMIQLLRYVLGAVIMNITITNVLIE